MKPARRYTLGERVGAPKALREDANPNRASRGVAYPSEIIPEWWAKSSRNAERHQIGMRAAARAARPPLRDRGFADSPLEEAVTSELVSEGQFPASWENTGNFIDSGLGCPNYRSKLR
jgi:hypothetical protein